MRPGFRPRYSDLRLLSISQFLVRLRIGNLELNLNSIFELDFRHEAEFQQTWTEDKIFQFETNTNEDVEV